MDSTEEERIGREKAEKLDEPMGYNVDELEGFYTDEMIEIFSGPIVGIAHRFAETTARLDLHASRREMDRGDIEKIQKSLGLRIINRLDALEKGRIAGEDEETVKNLEARIEALEIKDASTVRHVIEIGDRTGNLERRADAIFRELESINNPFDKEEGLETRVEAQRERVGAIEEREVTNQRDRLENAASHLQYITKIGKRVESLEGWKEREGIVARIQSLESDRGITIRELVSINNRINDEEGLRSVIRDELRQIIYGDKKHD